MRDSRERGRHDAGVGCGITTDTHKTNEAGISVHREKEMMLLSTLTALLAQRRQQFAMHRSGSDSPQPLGPCAARQRCRQAF